MDCVPSRLNVHFTPQNGVENKVADTFSHLIFILTKISMVVNDFEKINTEYESCLDFCDRYAILTDRSTREVDGYTLHDEYFSKQKVMHP